MRHSVNDSTFERFAVKTFDAPSADGIPLAEFTLTGEAVSKGFGDDVNDRPKSVRKTYPLLPPCQG